MNDVEFLKIRYKSEVNKLFQTHWVPMLDEEYSEVKIIRGKRSKNKSMKNFQDLINYVSENLSSITVSLLMKFFSQLDELPGPYKNSHKYLCLIYQLLSGKPNTEVYMPQTSYHDIYKKFYVGYHDDLNIWIDYFFKNCFSNEKLRILFGHLNNPYLFESVTMMMDSKDIVCLLSDRSNEEELTANEVSTIISRKNNWRSAGKTNFIICCQGYILNISFTTGANDIYDGEYIEKQKVHLIMAKNDVMMTDHHYNSGMKEVIKIFNN
jgi:hypothetical protein